MEEAEGLNTQQQLFEGKELGLVSLNFSKAMKISIVTEQSTHRHEIT